MRNTLVNILYEQAKLNKDLILMTGDLGFGVLTRFSESFPNQFINAGISEQNMTSVAAGLALEGKTVFTYSIANFPTLRCIEQIRNNIAYHQANVKIVAIGAGMAYGPSGMTHHGTEDIAIMRAIPGMTVFSPCDPEETRQVTEMALKIKTPCYIRIGKGGEQNINRTPFKLEMGKALSIMQGDDIAILATGAIMSEVIKAAEILRSKGINSAVYSFPTIKPIDEEMIRIVANKFKYIFTVEEHTVVGGFGSAVSEVIVQSKHTALVKMLGINDVFTSVVGSQEYLREYYELSGERIAQKVISIYNAE